MNEKKKKITTSFRKMNMSLCVKEITHNTFKKNQNSIEISKCYLHLTFHLALCIAHLNNDIAYLTYVAYPYQIYCRYIPISWIESVKLICIIRCHLNKWLSRMNVTFFCFFHCSFATTNEVNVNLFSYAIFNCHFFVLDKKKHFEIGAKKIE